MADIPGLIEGAADGAGLGIRFLKHLQRTRLLLHVVDIEPPDPDADPVKDARAIVAELKKFSPELAVRERWLVLNKIDLLDDQTRADRRRAVVEALGWKGRVYEIAAISGQGTDRLCGDLMAYLEERRALEQADPELAEAELQEQFAMQEEARRQVEAYRASRRRQARGDSGIDDDDFDDDDDVEVEYVP
jgi:GTP-binding protein